jgi:hypothetical protein
MKDSEAIELLSACKPLAVRISAIAPSTTPVNFALSQEDLKALEGFARVQNDPLVAGPGLLGRLLKAADLNQVEIYKLEQLQRLIARQRYGGRKATTRYKLESQ